MVEEPQGNFAVAVIYQKADAVERRELYAEYIGCNLVIEYGRYAVGAEHTEGYVGGCV